MEEQLNKIIEQAELEIVKYKDEIDNISRKISFCREHKFERERQYLHDKKEAMYDIFYDYKDKVQELRKLLNAWNS